MSRYAIADVIYKGFYWIFGSFCRRIAETNWNILQLWNCLGIADELSNWILKAACSALKAIVKKNLLCLTWATSKSMFQIMADLEVKQNEVSYSWL